MKYILLVAVLLGMLSSPSSMVSARTVTGFLAAQDGYYFDLPLCLPGMPEDGTCLHLGPAHTVAELRESGFPYPQRELSAAKPPSEMGVMPVLIGKINLPEEEPAPFYATFEDAINGSNPVRYIEPGRLRYISYVNRRDNGKKAYLQTASGEWMRAAPIAYTRFQGLQFFKNPQNDFGWMINFDPVQSHVEPSFGAQTSGNFYYRGDLIQVYDTVEAEGVNWHQINPDEWVNDRFAAVVSVNTTPPDGVNATRWVEVNLHQQTMSVYEDGRLLFATVVATGIEAYATKPGVFTIDLMKEMETMQGSFEVDRSDFYYLESVPWTIYYDDARAFHATYWAFPFGYVQSHGCINLSPGDAHWLFEWAEVGDFVWVHDPSGQTPTDPALYGRGAP